MKKNKEPIIARKMSIKVIYLKSFQRTHNKHLISNLRFLLCGKIPKKAKYCRTDCRKGLEYVFIALRFCRFFVHLFVCNYISVEFCGFFFWRILLWHCHPIFFYFTVVAGFYFRIVITNCDICWNILLRIKFISSIAPNCVKMLFLVCPISINKFTEIPFVNISRIFFFSFSE